MKWASGCFIPFYDSMRTWADWYLESVDQVNALVLLRVWCGPYSQLLCINPTCRPVMLSYCMMNHFNIHIPAERCTVTRFTDFTPHFNVFQPRRPQKPYQIFICSTYYCLTRTTGTFPILAPLVVRVQSGWGFQHEQECLGCRWLECVFALSAAGNFSLKLL